DPALRPCSLAARGLWIDLLCLMHESSRRGFLEHATGRPWTPEQIARVVGVDVTDLQQLLDELEGCGVFSRTNESAIFSRRMARDEHKRRLCAEAGSRGGGNPTFRGTFKGRLKGRGKGRGQGAPKRIPGSSASITSSASAKGATPPCNPQCESPLPPPK